MSQRGCNGMSESPNHPDFDPLIIEDTDLAEDEIWIASGTRPEQVVHIINIGNPEP